MVSVFCQSHCIVWVAILFPTRLQYIESATALSDNTIVNIMLYY